MIKGVVCRMDGTYRIETNQLHMIFFIAVIKRSIKNFCAVVVVVVTIARCWTRFSLYIKSIES